VAARRVLGAAAGVSCVVALCASCGVGAVELRSADLPDDVRAVCDDLLADVPSLVAGGERRDVSPYGAGAAWGDPATTLRCGVTDAEGMNPAMRCEVVEGVGWYAEKLEGGYRFTTIGRQTYVEVVVPEAQAQASAALVDLASAIRATVPEIEPCV
jgi:hypothetical protein